MPSDVVVAFQALVQSYTILTDMPENAVEHFDLIRQIADDNTKTPVGAAHDRRHGEYFGRRHASTMKRCIESFSDADTRDFDMLIRVAANGKPATILLNPRRTSPVAYVIVLEATSIRSLHDRAIGCMSS